MRIHQSVIQSFSPSRKAWPSTKTSAWEDKLSAGGGMGSRQVRGDICQVSRETRAEMMMLSDTMTSTRDVTCSVFKAVAAIKL